MTTILAAIAVVALCVFGMCFNIIFRKDGQFPETEISRNRELRKKGIRCAKDEEMKLWGRTGGKRPTCNESSCSECNSCGFYKKGDNDI